MDQKLLFLVNREWTNSTMDLVMSIASSFDLWKVPLLLAGIILLIRGSFKVRAFLLTSLIVVGVADGLIVDPLKKMVDRPRPHQALNDVRQVDLVKARPRILALTKDPSVDVKYSRISLEDVEGRSFPSAHTVNNSAVAILATCFFGRRGLLMFIPALIVGYSRIYVGAHWPSDVGISLLIGIGLPLLFLPLFEALWQRFGPRFLPNLHSRNPSLFRA